MTPEEMALLDEADEAFARAEDLADTAAGSPTQDAGATAALTSLAVSVAALGKLVVAALRQED